MREGMRADRDRSGILKNGLESSIEGGDELDAQAARKERGSLLLGDDGTGEGLALQSTNGAWASLPWEDVVAVPGAEIAPLWFTVDLVTGEGEYETHQGIATPVSGVSVGFIDLDDTSRLSLVLSATDVAGNTTVTSGPLVE